MNVTGLSPFNQILANALMFLVSNKFTLIATLVFVALVFVELCTLFNSIDSRLSKNKQDKVVSVVILMGCLLLSISFAATLTHASMCCEYNTVAKIVNEPHVLVNSENAFNDLSVKFGELKEVKIIKDRGYGLFPVLEAQIIFADNEIQYTVGSFK